MNNSDQKQKRKEHKKKDTHRQVSFIVAAVFFGFIIFVLAALAIHHDRSFSENENRMLQQMPAFTFSKLLSGKYMEEAEDFVADQFTGRDKWIQSKLKIDRVLGFKSSNGVYLGKDGYLIENTAIPDEERVLASVSAVNSFASNHNRMRTFMTIVPNASQILPQLCPYGAQLRDQGADIAHIRSMLEDGVTYIDLEKTMTDHSDRRIFYRSDHHWTSEGAMYAAETVLESMGISMSADLFSALTVAESFSGTMAASSGSFNTTDTVEIYESDDPVDYYVEYSGDPVKYSSIYSSAALDTKNKYEVFFGGNYSKISITTLNDTGRRLLLLKDSYANCFVQFLLPFFDRIVIIDPRYYSDELESDIASCGITDVLILYNENTFVQDNSLAGVLNGE